MPRWVWCHRSCRLWDICRRVRAEPGKTSAGRTQQRQSSSAYARGGGGEKRCENQCCSTDVCCRQIVCLHEWTSWRPQQCLVGEMNHWYVPTNFPWIFLCVHPFYNTNCSCTHCCWSFYVHCCIVGGYGWNLSAHVLSVHQYALCRLNNF